MQNPNPRQRHLHAIDVRSILASGIDPFEDILAAFSLVPESGVLEVTAPFRPTPLVDRMREVGHAVFVRVHAHGVHYVDIVKDGSKVIEDLTEEEPPAPLIRVLQAAASLASGEVYLARLPRHPSLLITRLTERGLEHEVLKSVDGTALLFVQGGS